MALSNDLIEKIEHLPEHQRAVVQTLVDQLARTGKTAASKSADWLGCLEHMHATIREEDVDVPLITRDAELRAAELKTVW